MAEITSARIEPLADSGDNQAGDSRSTAIEKRKATSKPAPPPPPVEVDDHEEIHQLDELA